jgi:hypothetical protein
VNEVDEVGEIVPDRNFREEIGGITPMTAHRYDRGEYTPPEWPALIVINTRKFRSRKQIDRYKAHLLRAAQQQHAMRAQKYASHRRTSEYAA